MLRALRGKLFVVGFAGIGLMGCTQTQIRLEPDFGSAVVQNTAAQIADPDAHYNNVPAPGSDGARVAAAQHRYETGRVIPPSISGATRQGSGSGFDNGAAPSSTGVGMATTTSGP